MNETKEKWDGKVTGKPFETRNYARVRLSESLINEMRLMVLEGLERTNIDEHQRLRREQVLYNVEGAMTDKDWL